MAAAHGALAWLAAAANVVLLVIAVATVLRGSSYRALDAALLLQVGTMGLSVLGGLGALVAGGTLADPLHLLYAIVALGVPIGVRAWAQRRGARAIGRWVAVAALVAVGATVRSFMTGS